MLGLKKKNRRAGGAFDECGALATSVQSRPAEGGVLLPAGAGERELYRSLREGVPIIDASIYKLRRLIGGFQVS